MNDFPELKLTNDEEIEQGHKNWLEWEHNNPNIFNNWFPHFVGLFNTPYSVGYQMTDDLLECLFLEEKTDKQRLLEWVKKEMLPSILNDFPKESKIFLKNGCFSNKFDFSRSCLVLPEEKTAEGLLEHILRIENIALCFDTCGDLYFVAREWIEPMPGTPTIYNGMPLRPEIRIFYDFDNKKLLYDKFYWDWDYCFPHIEGTEDEPEFTDTYPVIFDEYINKREWVLKTAEENLSKVEDMKGIWSIDFMLNDTQEGTDLWLIDAADAWQSAYWDPVRAGVTESAG
jgi:hypothetical protein